MAKLGDYRDRRFILFDQLKIQDLSEHEKFGDFDQETYDMVLSEAEKFAENVLWDLNQTADEEGCRWEDGKVSTPQGFTDAYQQYIDGGWLTATDDPDWGGQGLPHALGTACHECFHGSNSAFANYPDLTHGSGNLIHSYGTEEQKNKYLSKLWSGEWSGTMCLTEPGAGSDLGIMKTKATPLEDGTYKIEGQKIFITAGENDLRGNIVHPVLARIEGDPPGPKGISLFIVPKNKVNEDGSAGENNDVKCLGIEHKMGLKGSATCQLAFGDEGNCVGELLGNAREGLKIMFIMMNEERLLVAAQAMGIASSAYQLCQAYARERLQGRHLSQGKNPEAPPVPIIQHPDVRRMLMWMKSMSEGLRALNYYTGMCLDRAQVVGSDEQKFWQGMVEVLTPIVKAYGSDMAFRITEYAVQVMGGYGYCSEYRVEQCVRDVKITSIYEGTSGIQAMDLLGRKLPMAKGKVFEGLMQQIDPTMEEAKKSGLLKPYAEKLDKAKKDFISAVRSVGAEAGSEKYMLGFLKAYPLLEAMGDVLCAWMLLWQATVAEKKLSELVGDKDKKEVINENDDAAFLDGKIQSARFFIGMELPKISGKLDVLKSEETAALDIEEKSFT